MDERKTEQTKPTTEKKKTKERNDKEKRKSDDKPGYVESDYLSRPYVTIRFKQPT